MFAKTNKNEIKIDFLLGTENRGEKDDPDPRIGETRTNIQRWQRYMKM
jgi:hypothetical protein